MVSKKTPATPLEEDGSFCLDLCHLYYCQALTTTSRKLDQVFGGLLRTSERPLKEREMDLGTPQSISDQGDCATYRPPPPGADRNEGSLYRRRSGAELRR